MSSVRRAGGLTFCTLTAWDDEGAMRRFMGSGAHRQAMPKLALWCCEASYANWESDTAPSRDDGWRRLGDAGRISKVNHPTPARGRAAAG